MNALLAAQQARALELLPPAASGYYAAGAGDQVARDEAMRAWADLRLRPRVLRDVSTVDTSLTLLGSRLRTPVLVGPTALHGLAHPDGEAETARGTAQAGSLMVVSTRASRRLEDVPADGPWWFQAYAMRNRGLTLALVQRAVAAGAEAVVLTGDAPYLGQRPGSGRLDLMTEPLVNLAEHLADGDDGGRSSELDPSVGVDFLGELVQASGVPVLVKGVLRSDDALACLEAGAAGVIVSNHGGRQLDRAVSTATALPEVAEAVAGRAPVLVDGGLRSGLDVLCALALGADAVLLGRPALWALAADGAMGVQACLETLTAELGHAMGLAGAVRLSEVSRDLLA